MTIMKTASTLFSTLLLIGIFHMPVSAQCPPASSGYHRVLKGETLYRISKKYKVTVDQLCAWNGISKNSILTVCQELAVKGSAGTTSPSKPSTFPQNNLQKQQGGSHRIRQGETIAGLAELYGYTESRFREFNRLEPYERGWPGMELKTSECNCGDDDYDSPYVESDNSRYWDDKNQDDRNYNSYTDGNKDNNNYDDDYLDWNDKIASNDGKNSDDYNAPFGEDPFGGNTSVTAYNKDTKRKQAPRPSAYGGETGRVTPNARRKQNKTVPDNRVRRSSAGAGAPEKTYVSPEDELLRRNRKTSSGRNNRTSTSSTGATKDAARYMKPIELEMVKEINLLRSNPAGYVKYVEAYKRKIEAGQGFGTVATANELIAELRSTPTLSILKPMECLYKAAKNHGEDQKPTGETDHVGTDGSYPWDRVRRACSQMSNGGENLVAGPPAVRELMMLLLIDEGISNRGHRRTLLKRDWKYVACYEIGKVGRMPNSWVQKFGN